ncbi:hypothetical protein QFZ49_005061 [Streptomyces turgidiscabies]|uniref:Uncharacterized protein n=1 Tax=Streptomyces turgidiscabies TaxID=85558 RepID=A0ABU0RSZ8_9ACTN|nr:hypothetical protein [Streptomyces turgidiscabies]MDQ0935090.1 hypothetical protein [Streptomyces turgidiscabies]
MSIQLDRSMRWNLSSWVIQLAASPASVWAFERRRTVPALAL